jgi:lysozyme
MTLNGVDVSNNNGGIDWDAVSASGVQFAICKATQGTTFRDGFFADNMAEMKRLGLVRGAYHFARPSENSAEDEADFFVSVVQATLEPGDLVALDMEDENVPVGNDVGPWTLTWLRRVENALGYKPLVYTFPNYVPTRSLDEAELADYPLWWASYDVPPRDAPAPWGERAILQFTATGRVPGISGNVDLDSFDGTREDLLALGKPGAVGQSLRAFINARGETIIEINYGGTATDIDGFIVVDAGVSVRNAAGEIFDRSVEENEFEPWVRR